MTDAPTEGQPPEEQSSGFTFRDRRRVDPETGRVRTTATQESADEPAPAAAHGAAEAADAAGGDAGAANSAGAGAADSVDSDEVAKLRSELAERTADLQRVQAEYMNYRRRVDREREALKLETTGKALSALLPVLDDLDRAREHGELQGGFKAVADSLEKVTSGLGLERYGEEGEPFDPTVHEALTHDYSADVDGIVCSRIYQPGYRVGTRVLRAARVAVTEAEGGAVPASVEGAITLDDDGDDTASGDGATA